MSSNDYFDRYVSELRAQVRGKIERRKTLAKAVSIFAAFSAVIFAFVAFGGN